MPHDPHDPNAGSRWWSQATENAHRAAWRQIAAAMYRRDGAPDYQAGIATAHAIGADDKIPTLIDHQLAHAPTVGEVAVHQKRRPN